MTKEEIIEKYGNTPLKFLNYYKFAFTFRGDGENGDVIIAKVGGIADDIYELSLEQEETINNIEAHSVTIINDQRVIGNF